MFWYVRERVVTKDVVYHLNHIGNVNIAIEIDIAFQSRKFDVGDCVAVAGGIAVECYIVLLKKAFLNLKVKKKS